MGVDPVDGGDARRSLILRSDGKYALAGRDTIPVISYLLLRGRREREHRSVESMPT
jgi:hypothetical protein